MRSKLRALKQRLFGPPDEAAAPKTYFSEVYRRNWWGNSVSKSGQGSAGKFAEQKIAILHSMIADYRINTILDIGCGDCYWMRTILPSLQRYHGTDVVKQLVRSNTQRYGSPRITFQWIDLTNPEERKQLALKQADLITCLDVFGHLLNEEIDSLLPFVLNDFNARMLLVTNRRESGSADYLKRPKTRVEGVDLEHHPAFLKRSPRKLRQVNAEYPNDFFELYSLEDNPRT